VVPAIDRAPDRHRTARNFAKSGAVVAASKATSAKRKDLDAFQKLNATLELVLLKFVHQFPQDFVLYRKKLFLQLPLVKITLNCVLTEKCGSHAVPVMVRAPNRHQSAIKSVNRKAVVAVSITMSVNRKDTDVFTLTTVLTPSFRSKSTSRMKG